MALGLNFGTGAAGDGDSLLTAFTSINNMFSTTTKISGGDLTINDIRVGKGASNIGSNTALGNNALTANTSGLNNTAVGLSALAANTDGGYNTAVGLYALTANTSGIANTAIGNGSAIATQGGSSNTSLGSDSLFTNISGNNNTAIGKGALQLSTSNNNTAIGENAGSSVTTESNVTCLGYGAQAIASNQVVIGNDAVTSTLLKGEVNSAGSATFNGVKVGRGAGNITSNTAVGGATLTANTSGVYNSAFGLGSMNSNQGGQKNASFGGDSLFYNVSGNYNTAIGNSALVNSTLSNNTAVGFNAGVNVTSQYNTTCLGYNAQVTGSDQMRLGDSNVTAVVSQVGSWSDIRDKADVRDTVLGLDFINSLRAVDYKWDYREDYRTEMPSRELPLQELPIKELPLQGEISDEDYQEILEQYNLDYQELLDQSNADYQEILDQYNADYQILMDEWLESSKFSNLVHDGSKKRARYHHGLIAQEVQEVIEESGVDFGGFQDHTVNGGDEVMTISYMELITPMIKAIQELTARINVLEGN